MPKLWSDTIDAHRREVREAIMGATARLGGELGVMNVTMSQVAQAAGIGRATLYKYFSNVEEILHAWHDQRIEAHLAHLTEIAERAAPASQRLASVLAAYAQIRRQRSDHGTQPHGSQLVLLLHRDERLRPAERRLRTLVEELLTQGSAEGRIRADVPPAELALYCLHALDAAHALPSAAATERLVALVLNGLQPHS